jgi:hypothetical protein
MLAKRISLKGVANVLIVLVCSNCLSPVNLDIHSIGGTVVISGQVSTLEGATVIQVGQTAGNERLPMPLSYANVTLFDDLGNSFELYEDPSKPGNYLSTTSGIAGRTYHVSVTTPSGVIYESAPEKIPVTSISDTVTYKFEQEEQIDAEGVISTQWFLKIYVSNTLPNEERSFLKWETQEVYVLVPTDFPDIFGNIPPSCYITQNADPQRIVLFNNNQIEAKETNELMIVKRIVDQSFHTRHYFNIYNTSMTAEAYEYWRKVNILANQVGSIFDAPPAEITGNIFRSGSETDRAIGYVQAVNQTFKRISFVQADLPNPLPVYCEYDGSKPQREAYTQACLDCLSVANSSYQRPGWF